MRRVDAVSRNFVYLRDYDFASRVRDASAGSFVCADSLLGIQRIRGVRQAGWTPSSTLGLAPRDDPKQGIGEAEWRAFLDREVTPRFPSGLSVLDVYGQWQGKNEHAPERLRSKMLIIDYPDTDRKSGED